MKRKFFIFTADHSGLPLATKIQEEGNDVTLAMIRPEERDGKFKGPQSAKEAQENLKRIKYLNRNASNVVNKLWAEDAMRQIGRGSYVFFDQIYGWQYGEALRKRGVKVWGGLKMGFTLETERQDTLTMLKRFGMDVPMQKKFGPHSSKKGIQFLESIKDEMLFVFKSDNPKIVTAVAYDSNDELIQKLESEGKEIDGDGFLLQQKIVGVEFAVETLYCAGKPVASNVDIEAKKKYNEMSEVQTGCSHQLLWFIPLDHPLRKRVNAPFDNFAAKNIGTGFLDASVIYDPKEDKMYALEVCGCRPAFNAFYSELALLKVPVGDFVADIMDGKFSGDIGQKVFEPRFAGSLRVFNDDHTADQRIDYSKEYRKNYWLWDCYKKGGHLFTTGDESLGIVTGDGENPEGALAKVRENYFHLHMPTMWARDDFDEDDEVGLPLARYHAMKRMKLL